MQCVFVRYARNPDRVDIAQHSERLQNPMLPTSSKSGITRICKVYRKVSLKVTGVSSSLQRSLHMRPGQCISSWVGELLACRKEEKNLETTDQAA